MSNLSNLLKKIWPDVLAVLLFIADYSVKRLNDYAATHEHSTILVLLIAVLAAWHAQHVKPGDKDKDWGGPPSTGSSVPPGKTTRP